MPIETTTLDFSSPTPRGAAVDEWEMYMSQSYVPVSVDPHPERPFYGRVTSGTLPGPADFTLATFAGSHQVMSCSRSQARAGEGYLLASVHIDGQMCMNQDGRRAPTRAGDMVFFDTSVPYHWDNGPDDWSGGAAFEVVIVQVPLRLLRAQPGLDSLRLPTAVTVPADSPAGAVAGFFRRLARFQVEAPAEAQTLASSALGMIGSAVLLAAGKRPVDEPADQLSREHVMTYLREHCTDPGLTIDEVAAVCHISRRTLFRIFDGGDSVGATLRKLRVRRAQTMLASARRHSFAEVAFGSGFASERHFYRCFRRETGMTPGEYRQVHRG
ncbi:helix-turn-helix domain-containing protein [Nocardia sp. NPDC058666]|uniref:helix-turn-helix domain-containing protein n=1 Tax=unclassified Nocardia TaxID=2637762 RepID=UPI00364E9747